MTLITSIDESENKNTVVNLQDVREFVFKEYQSGLLKDLINRTIKNNKKIGKT